MPSPLLVRLASTGNRSSWRRGPISATFVPLRAAPLRLGEFRFDVERELLLQGKLAVRLTTAEAKMLRRLALNHGDPVSREELSLLSGPGGNVRSVDVQIARLRRKIEPDPRLPRYLHTVRGQGYALKPD